MIPVKLITIDSNSRLYMFCDLCGNEIIKDGVTPFVVFGNRVQYAHTHCMDDLNNSYKQLIDNDKYEE